MCMEYVRIEEQYVLYGQRPVYACGDEITIDDEVPTTLQPAMVVRGFDVLCHWRDQTARVDGGSHTCLG